MLRLIRGGIRSGRFWRMAQRWPLAGHAGIPPLGPSSPGHGQALVPEGARRRCSP
jgi:hypothetical protein